MNVTTSVWPFVPSLPVSSLNWPAILIQFHLIHLDRPQLILLKPQGHNCIVEKHSLHWHRLPLSWLCTMKNCKSFWNLTFTCVNKFIVDTTSTNVAHTVIDFLLKKFTDFPNSRACPEQNHDSVNTWCISRMWGLNRLDTELAAICSACTLRS